MWHRKKAPSAPSTPIIFSPSGAQYFDDFFAVIIGIDAYQEQSGLNPLSYAASDANLFESWLISKGVPKKHITSLRNEEATGKGIRDALQSIAENPNIGRNSKLTIYFAGHGSKKKAPSDFPTGNGEMQMLLPQDFDSRLKDDIKGSWTQPGRPIFDVEFGYLIRSSVNKKGLHITVILDCCHSGSGTRGGSSNLTVRGCNLPPEYTLPTDPLPPWFSDSYAKPSHILLAASHESQQAYENPSRGHGRFTYALVDILRKADKVGNLNLLTYSEAISLMVDSDYEFNIKETMQTPRVEGDDAHCVIFTRHLPPSRPIIYRVETTDKGFSLERGTESGITTGTQFEVYIDERLTSESRVASIRADSATAFVTHCSLLSTNSKSVPSNVPLFAVETVHGQRLKLFIDQGDRQYNDLKTMVHDSGLNDISIGSIDIVSVKQEADLAIITEESGTTLAFEVINPGFLQYSGGTRLLAGSNISVNDKGFILKVLRAAVHFFRQLDLPNTGNLQGGSIDVECRQVRQGEILNT
ncbi:hypothetical protein H0H93_008075, partial [Arthromyces matolae]